jgi:hypothetical protein
MIGSFSTLGASMTKCHLTANQELSLITFSQEILYQQKQLETNHQYFQKLESLKIVLTITIGVQI